MSASTEKKIENIVKSVVYDLDRTEVRGYTLCRPSCVRTEEAYVQFTDDGRYEVNLRTYDLKEGGPEDRDNNDELMESELRKNFKKILEKKSKDLKITGSFYGEKGSWGFYVELASEAKSNKARAKAREAVEKHTKELNDFNDSVFKRIKGQKSKKKTCTKCDSNVNTSFLKSHKCPVCNSEMYTDTDLKRVNNIKAKIKKQNQALKAIGAQGE